MVVPWTEGRTSALAAKAKSAENARSALMSERIRQVKHRGKSIMDVNFTNCSAEEMLTILDELRLRMAKHAPNTVLALADYSGAEVNKAVATRIKEVLVL